MRTVVAVWIMLAGTAVNASDVDKPWSGSAALGILATSGNSETTSSNLDLTLNFDSGQWHHIAKALAAGADSAGQTTAERYKASYKANRDFTKFDYLFALVGYEKDKFSGYDQQTSQSFGYGRRILNREKQVLNLEAGAGFKQTTLRDNTKNNGAIFRLGGDYLLKMSPTAQFSQLVSIEQGSGNTYIESISAVKATLIEQLGLVLSFTVKSNSEVPVNSKKRDTFTAISLEYGF